jgi:multidrug resistance protein, MATE family
MDAAIHPRRPARGAGWSEFAATAALAWPLILSNLSQVAMHTTDVALMGRLGADALAAGALGANLYFFFLIFGIGLVLATSPMLARELGANRFAVREVRRTVRQGLWTAAILCIPFWLALWHAEAIMLALGQDPDLSRDAAAYVRALQWGMLPALAFIVLRSFVAALERPGAALAVSLAAILLNGVVAWALIFGRLGLPAMGIVGAGVATTASNLFMLAGLMLLIRLDRRFRRYRLFGRWWRPDGRRFAELWRLGVPMAATLTFEVSIFNAAAFAMGLISPAALAAHQIAIQLASAAFMVPMGVAQAATVRVGRAFGAGDTEGVGRAGAAALLFGIGFMALTAVLFVAAPGPLVAVFLDTAAPANAEVVGLAVVFLVWAAVFQLVDGAQAVGNGLLRGLHDTRVPMLYALLGYWVIGFPLGLVLAFRGGLGGSGIWIGLATGLAVVAALLLRRWARRAELGLLKDAGRAG